jgi:hypothetical protein
MSRGVSPAACAGDPIGRLAAPSTIRMETIDKKPTTGSRRRVRKARLRICPRAFMECRPVRPRIQTKRVEQETFKTKTHYQASCEPYLKSRTCPPPRTSARWRLELDWRRNDLGKNGPGSSRANSASHWFRSGSGLVSRSVGGSNGCAGGTRRLHRDLKYRRCSSRSPLVDRSGMGEGSMTGGAGVHDDTAASASSANSRAGGMTTRPSLRNCEAATCSPSRRSAISHRMVASEPATGWWQASRSVTERFGPRSTPIRIAPVTCAGTWAACWWSQQSVPSEGC